uniref:Uncharacterized protein n=1 Tax=Candidatus Kentrum sp. LPFa TaxID=2126335 RepID=A0A450VPL7_9GAMM|nr:MAG: hypothetical protein BECKLPF1236B_GA0070989_100216 [Candidatus Kentron sp. LPFa]
MSNNILSEEDFARARAAMRERDQGLSEVRTKILERFQGEGLHEAFILYSPANVLFVAYLFYLCNDQIKKADESGLASRIKQAVIEELGCVGRGNRDTIKIDFEFDSHENVEANFEGNYYNRLH